MALLVALPALAQGLQEMNLFAPADLSTYGSGPQPNEGYFFVFDGLSWAISAPSVTPIGFPNLTRLVFHTPSVSEVQHNTQDTGPLEAAFTEGNRIEFGRITDRNGWMVSVYNLSSQNQRFDAENVDIVFQDIAFGPTGRQHLEGWVFDALGYDGGEMVYGNEILADLPVTFDEITVRNRVDTCSVELMAIHRSRPFHHGGIFEFFAGVRYMEFDEKFSVDARGVERTAIDGTPLAIPANSRWVYDASDSPIGPGNVLADSNWDTEAENHIIGPQIGGRWYKKRGRWTFSTEGRFLAGFNSQNIHQRGTLGDKLDEPMPFNWTYPLPFTVYPYVPELRVPYNVDHSRHFQQWSPVAELRAELVYQLTRSISVKAGWTGTWMWGIARPSDMINYTLSETSYMGIIEANNDGRVFMNGLNIGVTVNR